VPRCTTATPSGSATPQSKLTATGDAPLPYESGRKTTAWLHQRNQVPRTPRSAADMLSKPLHWANARNSPPDASRFQPSWFSPKNRLPGIHSHQQNLPPSGNRPWPTIKLRGCSSRKWPRKSINAMMVITSGPAIKFRLSMVFHPGSNQAG